MDVDMMSDDRGLNDWRDRFRSPARSALEEPSSLGRLSRFPRVDRIDMLLGRIRRSMRGDWFGTHVRLLPAQPCVGWFPKLNGFARVLKCAADSDLFVGESGCFLRRIPTEENVDLAAMSIAKIA